MGVVSVSSVFSEVNIGGAKVPLGLIMSFAKPNHNSCMGRGFTSRVGGSRDVCTCAKDRAVRHLQAVGAAKFSEEGEAWKKKERERVANEPA